MNLRLISYAGMNASENAFMSLRSSAAFFIADSRSLDREVNEGSEPHKNHVRFDLFEGEPRMHNRCENLSCSLNGTSVAVNTCYALVSGDVIEIGLCRLTIENDQGKKIPAMPDQNDSADIHELMQLEGQQSYNALFDAEKASNDKSREEWRPVTQDLANEDPLDVLANEYREAMLSGIKHDSRVVKQIDSNLPGSAAFARPANSYDDPFESGRAAQDSGSLLSDLLGSKQGIDSIIASLDQFGHLDLFKPDAHTEILGLLAPPGARPVRSAWPPELALREHHMISMDSAVNLGSARTETTS